MSMFSKSISKEERESLELAEDSRQDKWIYPSFASCLFQGKVEWNLIWPFPEQSKEDKEEGDRFLSKLEKFLKEMGKDNVESADNLTISREKLPSEPQVVILNKG